MGSMTVGWKSKRSKESKGVLWSQYLPRVDNIPQILFLKRLIDLQFPVEGRGGRHDRSLTQVRVLSCSDPLCLRTRPLPCSATAMAGRVRRHPV